MIKMAAIPMYFFTDLAASTGKRKLPILIKGLIQERTSSNKASFNKAFLPRGVLDEILNLIESVSEDFPSYSSICSYIGK